MAKVSTAAALDGAYAADVAATVLQQAWAARETGAIKLPPSRLALDAGDAVTVTVAGVTLAFRIKAVETTTYRALDLVGFDPSLLRGRLAARSASPARRVPAPSGRRSSSSWRCRPSPAASRRSGRRASPPMRTPGRASTSIASNGGGGWTFVTTVESPSTMGELTSPLYAGPVDRWDGGNSLYVRFYGAANLLSLTEGQVLGGAGAIGSRIRTAPGRCCSTRPRR